MRVTQQILVPPACGDTALVENDDVVSIGNGGQTMGYDDDGLVHDQRIDAFLNQMLVFRICPTSAPMRQIWLN